MEDKVQHLPSFLEALSCIVEELDEVCTCRINKTPILCFGDINVYFYQISILIWYPFIEVSNPNVNDSYYYYRQLIHVISHIFKIFFILTDIYS